MWLCIRSIHIYYFRRFSCLGLGCYDIVLECDFIDMHSFLFLLHSIGYMCPLYVIESHQVFLENTDLGFIQVIRTFQIIWSVKDINMWLQNMNNIKDWEIFVWI